MPSQSYQVIRDRLFIRLKAASGKKVAYNHKIATHIGSHPASLPAFLSVLNDHPEFKAEGLFLAPGSVLQNDSVENLLAAIFRNYKARGWTIYYA
ncbi:hypothetical protein [Sulfitobacter geojensis]|uniref:Uncharacterized protein n=1 Tax=Sulfitobacter geojensis TaxID=1342299 RepID=A0AAE2W1T4_9RHOB|nr:hypothetical protein [Sulfitobacter geojensis]MBM1691605.1 hypothetical protein [Sulfitobacter geojensis]MBM1695671.1 hypothetical protein [Sulfitobacter geojensis]MBM1707836.1 hypothetical protein [Sulfitobacter geojensis]MBM1711895.1 hypothetical protein [Sulfitobacter geojensis]MBM1715960.1 hypothetical protein [Sulfitobacter geojensis]